MGQLGDTLRERRIALGITLEQAEEGTKIRGKLLEALEDGDYGRLPNPGYVRGYISSYARYLELDPVPLLAMYQAETGAGRYHEIEPAAGRPRSSPRGRAARDALARRSQRLWSSWRVLSLTHLGASSGCGAGPRSRRPSRPCRRKRPRRSSPSGDDTQPTSPAVDPAEKPPAKYTPFTVKVTVASQAAPRGSKRAWTARQRTRDRSPAGSSKSFEVNRKAATHDRQARRRSPIYRDGKKVAIPDQRRHRQAHADGRAAP